MKVKDKTTGLTLESKCKLTIAQWKKRPDRYVAVSLRAEKAEDENSSDPDPKGGA